MGIPTLRLRADYLAIVTIAVAEVIRLVVRSVKFRDQFGGTDGLKDFANFVPAGRGRPRAQPGLDVRLLGVQVLRAGISGC